MRDRIEALARQTSGAVCLIHQQWAFMPHGEWVDLYQVWVALLGKHINGETPDDAMTNAEQAVKETQACTV